MFYFPVCTVKFVLILMLASQLCGWSTDAIAAEPEKPNIVLINLDDADYRMFAPELLELYPNIQRLANSGVSFSNLHVTTPFCGPSRASLFRGQYAHRTGVRVNIPESPLSLGFKGGYSEFLRQEHDRDELGVWMQTAGYRTMMIGKYHHNGFDFKIPPGWDDFYMSNGGRYQGTYRFINQNKSAGENTRNGLEVYRTDQEADDAVRLIGAHVASSKDQPFFLYLAPLAPHRPVGPDFTLMVDKPKYGDWHGELRIPQTPDFDEAQISDKPLHRQSPPYSESELEVLHSEYLCRARAVKSVDVMVGRVVESLKKAGVYENTYILFTSDNGCLLGQHRLHNKLDPYEMSTRVPLFVVGPGIKPHAADHLLAHIDICATILELGKAKTPDFIDGKSFVPLLEAPGSFNESAWRKPVVIENWQTKRNRRKSLPCMYSGLRYYDQLYVEWATGDKEYYDLASDPFELENTYSKLSAVKKLQMKNDLLRSRSVPMNPLLTVIPKGIETGRHVDPAVIRGYAEDDFQVRSVQLQIEDSKSKRYWDGSDWGESPFELTANLPARDQQMVEWSYAFKPMGDSIPFKVKAWAVDDKENKSNVVSMDFPAKQ